MIKGCTVAFLDEKEKPLLNGRSEWCTENYGAHPLAVRKLVLLGAHGLIYGVSNWVRIPDGYWNRLLSRTGGGGTCAWEQEVQEDGAEDTWGDPGQPGAEQTALDIPALLQSRRAHSAGCPGTAQERIQQLEGLQREWMSLKFWSIKVILYPATEAVGQRKQITVHSPNRKIKTQEAAKCCRQWPWLHNPANSCCLWGCTAVSEKTNLLVQKLLFSIMFLSFFFLSRHQPLFIEKNQKVFCKSKRQRQDVLLIETSFVMNNYRQMNLWMLKKFLGKTIWNGEDRKILTISDGRGKNQISSL